MARLPCCDIRIIAFRGKRDRTFTRQFLRSVRVERATGNNGPSEIDCLIYAGHVGIQPFAQGPIFGFHPITTGIASGEALHRLTTGRAFPGHVQDDTSLFESATLQYLLPLQSLQIRLPQPDYDRFNLLLDGERIASKYSYGFPNGDGDCNCVTWLERLGLPLLTGQMDEFLTVKGFSAGAIRRFGRCT